MRKTVSRRILAFALPSMGSSVISILYNTVDLMWIGRFGKEAVASVTLAVNFYSMNYILNEIFGVASVVLLSRRWGEKNYEEFQRIGRQIAFYKFLSGLLLLFITSSLSSYVLYWMGSGNINIDAAMAYYKWRIVFLPFGFLYGTMMTTYRSIGDTKTLFIISAIWGSANVVLDPIFMFNLNMGVVGSAVASGICETAAMFHGFLWAKKKWNVWMLKVEKPHLSLLKKIFKIGTPSLLDAINWDVSRLIIVKIFSYIGVTATAVFGVYSRVLDITWMIAFAIEGAITTLVGQSLGENNKEKAMVVFKEGLKLSVLMGSIVAILIFIFAHPIVSLFAREKDFAEASAEFLRYASLGFLFLPFMNVSYGTLIGGGRTIDTLMISSIGNWAYRIPLLIVVSRFTSNLNILALAYSSFIVFSGILGLFMVKKGKWLHVEV
ncbi:MAG: MATE family efflux transporter [Thermotogaceae bacterium]|nr:MATE family efflux transporter [Thermotogaceae bacterium]